MDSITLSTLTGAVISLAFKYFPFISEWYNNIDGSKKAFFMLVSMVLVTAGVFVSNCYGFYNTGLSCDNNGAMELVKVFISALIANQSVYTVTKKL